VKWIVLILIFWSSTQCFGQRGYTKDSLQFKAYIHLTYLDAKVKGIKVKKVFCDYCTDGQLKHLKQRFWDMANSEKYDLDMGLGKVLIKRSLITRIAKEDFKNMNNE